ncbi:hypothetical protein JCM19294_2498 [Nonlabens tegetincola]|uniref:Uncharacterized protein n=1 Tax=Nonlabens tegetincola TaxID=323273 RepID=A0A090QJJ6_9FLAO|nr:MULTISPECIES: hypothetical protein [Nonlabens]ALM20916.1 hypothetical protein AAT17_06600 [Nonlabens sp. MIC269]ARN72364.1 hypothetical protein BST91_12180 [Nonlabens tegetincola]MEE2800683.1 hypothetical protein [Bacteroidota bacterium]GAK95716.1 hypothetical protein JCM19294_2498 [Nonlabens tegetincola]
MSIEKIKCEVASRIEQLMQHRKKSLLVAQLLKQNVKSWPEKVAETNELVNKAYEVINEVLLQHQIKWNNDLEREGIISYLEPTVHDIVIKNMDD